MTSKPPGGSSGAQKRLESVVTSLNIKPGPELLGRLNVGDLSLPIYECTTPARLPRESSRALLNYKTSPEIIDHLSWMLQKHTLGQDMFLIGPPGPLGRRLATTFASLLNKPYEVLVLHRDVSAEADLRQGREIRAGQSLEYVDSAAVRAAKDGNVLILDGIERCERGVLPTLNNLLENREINLEDGTHIVSADRYDKMLANGEDTRMFIPAHREFRVIALGTPVPPYPGFPLDPPFRSRFQARYLDPLSSGQTLANQAGASAQGTPAADFITKVSNAISTVQVSREMKARMAAGVMSSEEVPSFPQTALLKLQQFLSIFPPPADASLSTPSQVLNVLLTIHPALGYLSAAGWRSFENALESSGLEEWTSGIAECDSADVALQGVGIWGWDLKAISRVDDKTAKLTFVRGGVEEVVVNVPAGPLPFTPYPLTAEAYPDIYQTPRFAHLLTSLFQLHALGLFDISFLPPSSSLQTSSASSTLVINTFAGLLGYELCTIHLFREIGGREIWMRRVVNSGADGHGSITGWEPSLLTKAALEGQLVHLEGIDTIGATAGSLGRLLMDRENELWEGKRLVGPLKEGEETAEILSHVSPSFRIIATSSKASPPKEWLTEELASNFISLPSIAMGLDEEKHILLATGCPKPLVDKLETFARAYRRANSAPGSKSRRLGTASLVRVAERLARYPNEGLRSLLERTLLSAFLPATFRGELGALFEETDIQADPVWWNPPAEVQASTLVFPAASDPDGKAQTYEVPLFDISQDPAGSSYVPFMNNYLDNSQQTALQREIATDLEVLGEHVLLLGNQGVGKNKIVDCLLQRLGRPREFIQLHRDSTTQSLQYQTSLEGGVIRSVDAPLIRAVQLGRVLVIDEVDKAAAPVVASLASLAGRGEMTLSDGRRIRPPGQHARDGDIVVHPNFRLILLANRPGFPFLGNPFLRVLGDNFSCFAVGNPDVHSEERVLSQLAPDLDPLLVRSLVAAFGDLRAAFEDGSLAYPFSLRELLALVRHLKMYPNDPLEDVLRNVFDFDVNRPETLEKLYAVLRRHKLAVERIGIDAVRKQGEEGGKPKPKVIDFEPENPGEVNEPPKFGKEDNKQHSGGNTWAGGTGGRSTAGLGGRGGYMRLYKPGQDIKQIPERLKAQVPSEIQEQAREMARKELAKRLAEIDLTTSQGAQYTQYHNAVLPHVQQLVTFLDNLEANEEERVWLKRQGDGELDESRLSEGLTGETTIYKRRGMEKPELGRPQLKPKRLRFVFDLSASMYRNQYDGRLARSLEAAVLILESFSRLARKEKYRIDLVGHSGEEPVIPLVPVDELAQLHAGDFFKVIQKAALVPQFCWSGDHTLDAIEKGIESVAEADADDYFLICITDANFGRYGIEDEHLKRAMNSNPKVKSALIAIGEGAEAVWLPRALPGRAHRVQDTSDIATVLRTILGSMLTGEL